jgi:enamine deaminase RidA (YjgF/YER057c/UK114 family)
MRLDVRQCRSDQALELYVAAIPDPGRTLGDECGDVFATIEDVVHAHGARICRERVFIAPGQQPVVEQARATAYSRLDALAPPDWLLAGTSDGGAGGVQVHAVRGPRGWRPLHNGAGILGWCFEQDDRRWAVTGGLALPLAGDGPAQARAVFEKAANLLAQAEMDLSCIARTWIYMDDILSWYSPFNRERNRLFVERGLLATGDPTGGANGKNVWLVPASTGMGISPARGGKIALEVFAVTPIAAAGGNRAGAACIERHAAAGRQRSAFEYGSAFARSATADTPAGKTVFVSGTAAIDEQGRTCFVGDARGQMRMTLHCLLAVLRDRGCTGPDVVQAIAYCKTPYIAAEFRRIWGCEIAWPWLTVVGDVCRDDLLFEVEVTAFPGASSN